jgi:hypothetical protein
MVLRISQIGKIYLFARNYSFYLFYTDALMCLIYKPCLWTYMPWFIACL